MVMGGGTSRVAGFAHGGLHLQHEGVGLGYLDLTAAAQGAQNAHILNGAHGGADQCAGLLAGKLPGLGQILQGGQLVALAKQGLHILAGQVDMAVGNSQRYGVGLLVGRRVHAGDDLPDDRFD